MEQDAHQIAETTSEGGDPTTVLAKDLSDKLATCQGSYKFTLHATVKTTYAASDGLAFDVDFTVSVTHSP